MNNPVPLVRLELSKRASPPPPELAQAIVVAVRVALGDHVQPVPVKASAWRFSGRWWQARPGVANRSN